MALLDPTIRTSTVPRPTPEDIKRFWENREKQYREALAMEEPEPEKKPREYRITEEELKLIHHECWPHIDRIRSRLLPDTCTDDTCIYKRFSKNMENAERHDQQLRNETLDPLAKVYERFKHFDNLICDPDFVQDHKDEGDYHAILMHDMWLAIKETLNKHEQP
jgi:hypothetical protein